MCPIYIPHVCFLMLLSFRLTAALPLQSAALTKEDMEVLKLLLHRFEESVPTNLEDQMLSEVDTLVPNLERTALSEEEDRTQPQANARSEDAKDYLSARDLRTVRNDSGTKRYSGCFSRRLDRIGSMSSLGCNTIGRHNPKRK
ncbi:natriuretic peptides B [Brachyhypopomus gauderio]|uniref:natriuretic peptides B n=1 Tax=Brachyhypopomus gauderio TaxID=698409 RepID=UPI0040422339